MNHLGFGFFVVAVVEPLSIEEVEVEAETGSLATDSGDVEIVIK